MLKCSNDSLKTEHFHLAFKIKMALFFANGTFKRLPDGSFWKATDQQSWSWQIRHIFGVRPVGVRP